MKITLITVGKIKEKYLKDGETYELRPLYNNDDKLQYFVVDFSNNDFIYVKIMEW